MQQTQSDRAAILAHVQRLQEKVQTLQFVYKHLYQIDVKLEITFRTGDRILLDQLLIPFSLEMEIKNLIGDSIDEYQRQIINLTTVANENDQISFWTIICFINATDRSVITNLNRTSIFTPNTKKN